MVEKQLSEKFARIFDLKRVSFNDPGEAQEQDVLFVDMESSKYFVKDGRATGRATGKCHVFTQWDRMPVGYFAQKIAAADKDDTKDFFFFNVEESIKKHENLVERTFSFTYFFSNQYDPNIGTITSIQLEQVTE